jgi:hypothetical protein
VRVGEDGVGAVENSREQGEQVKQVVEVGFGVELPGSGSPLGPGEEGWQTVEEGGPDLCLTRGAESKLYVSMGSEELTALGR